MVLAGVIAIIVILCVVGGFVVYYMKKRSTKVAPEPSRTGEAADQVPTTTGAAAGSVAHALMPASQPLGENVRLGESYRVHTAEGSRNTGVPTREEDSADSIPASPKPHRLSVMSAAVTRPPSVSAPSPMPESARLPNRPDGEAAHDDEHADAQPREHVNGRPLTQDRSAKNSFGAAASRASTPLPPPAALSPLKVHFQPEHRREEGTDDENNAGPDTQHSNVTPFSNMSNMSAHSSFTGSPRDFNRPNPLSAQPFSDARPPTSTRFARFSQPPGDSTHNDANTQGPVAEKKECHIARSCINTPNPGTLPSSLLEEWVSEDEIAHLAGPSHFGR